MLQILILAALAPCYAQAPPSVSIFTQPFPDPAVIDALASACGLRGDGIADDTLALQCAVNLTYSLPGSSDCTLPGRHVVALAGGGRAYRVTAPVYLPIWVRLLGYGATRPRILLAPSTPGYALRSIPIPLLFVVNWASATPPLCNVSRYQGGNTAFGTGVLNVDFEIAHGNPSAVAISNGAAQGGQLSSLHFFLANDTWGGVANPGWAHSDLVFVGGKSAVLVNHTGAWPSLFRECVFYGQGGASIVFAGQSSWEGVTVLRGRFVSSAHAVNASAVASARWSCQDCRFEGMQGGALILPPALANSSLLLSNCSGSGSGAVLVAQDAAGVLPAGGIVGPQGSGFWGVARVVVGWLAGDLRAPSAPTLSYQVTGGAALPALPPPSTPDVPPLPPMPAWVPVTQHGIAAGSSPPGNNSALLTALLAASPPGAAIYFPLGVYLFDAPVRIPGSARLTLLGLHCWDVVLSLKDNAGGFMDPNATLPFLHVLPSGSGGSGGGGAPWVRGMNVRSGVTFGVPQPPPVPAGWYNPNPGALALLWEAGGGGLADVFFHPATFPDNSRLGSGPNTELSLVLRGPSAAMVAAEVWSCNAYSQGGARVEAGARALFLQLSSEHHEGQELLVRNAGSSARVLVMQTEDRSPDAAPTSSVRVEGGAAVEVTGLFSYYAARVPSPAAVLVDAQSSAQVRVFRQWHSYHPMFYNCSVLGLGGGAPCLAATDFAQVQVSPV